MSKVIYYGKKNRLCGKTAFEILARLKNFGIGRVLQRNLYKLDYPGEESYCRVVEVEPQMDEQLSFGRLWVHEVFRGKMYPKLREIRPWHPDYSLVPKHLEPDFSKFPVLGHETTERNVLPATCEVPPLMAEYMNRKKLGRFPNIYIRGLNREKHGYDSEFIKKFTVTRRYVQEEKEPEEFDYWNRIAGPGDEVTISTKKIIVDKFNDGIQPI